MSDDFDAPKEMDRANLFLNHGRAKHADACWRCDEPWPCLTMRVVIDADHEWAQWHDKWIAALDLMGSQSERAEKAEAERDAARDWVRRMHREQQVLTCVYCGHAYPPRTPASGSDVLTAHIKVCEKHPLREAEAEASEHESRANRWMVQAQHAEAELAAAIKQALEQHRIVQDLGRELRAANERTERLEEAARPVLSWASQCPPNGEVVQHQWKAALTALREALRSAAHKRDRITQTEPTYACDCGAAPQESAPTPSWPPRANHRFVRSTRGNWCGRLADDGKEPCGLPETSHPVPSKGNLMPSSPTGVPAVGSEQPDLPPKKGE